MNLRYIWENYESDRLSDQRLRKVNIAYFAKETIDQATHTRYFNALSNMRGWQVLSCASSVRELVADERVDINNTSIMIERWRDNTFSIKFLVANLFYIANSCLESDKSSSDAVVKDLTYILKLAHDLTVIIAKRQGEIKLGCSVDICNDNVIELLTAVIPHVKSPSSLLGSAFPEHYIPRNNLTTEYALRVFDTLVKGGADVKVKEAAIAVGRVLNSTNNQDRVKALNAIIEAHPGVNLNGPTLASFLGNWANRELVKIAVENGFNLKEFGANMMSKATEYNYGSKDKEDFLYFLVHDIDVFSHMKLSKSALNNSIKRKQYKLVEAMISSLSDTEILTIGKSINLACRFGSWEGIAVAISRGLTPTYDMVDAALTYSHARCLEELLRNESAIEFLEKVNYKKLVSFMRRLPTGPFLEKMEAYMIARELTQS